MIRRPFVTNVWNPDAKNASKFGDMSVHVFPVQMDTVLVQTSFKKIFTSLVNYVKL
jgi:hypothetical protein